MFLRDLWWERLREERDRLGINQTKLGQIGGVRKQTQIAYEKGSDSVDIGYLKAIGDAGVDVRYILTGVREQDVPMPAIHEPRQTYVIDAVEQALIENFRACSEPMKHALQVASRAYARNAPDHTDDEKNGGGR